MITIRYSAFETNSSSSHAFIYKINKKIAMIERYYDKKCLEITGINATDPECQIKSFNDKVALIAMHCIVTEDNEQLALLESVIKENLPMVTEIKYNIVFSSKGWNACYSPSLMQAIRDRDSFDGDEDDDLAYDKFRDECGDPKNSFENIIADRDKLKAFLFGHDSELYGIADYEY